MALIAADLNAGVIPVGVVVVVVVVECCFTSTETVGLLGTGALDGRLDFHTAPELCLRW